MKALALTALILASTLNVLAADGDAASAADPNPTPEIERGYYTKNTQILNVSGPAAVQIWQDLGDANSVPNQPGENRTPTRQKDNIRCSVGFSSQGGRRSTPVVNCQVSLKATLTPQVP